MPRFVTIDNTWYRYYQEKKLRPVQLQHKKENVVKSKKLRNKKRKKKKSEPEYYPWNTYENKTFIFGEGLSLVYIHTTISIPWKIGSW